MKKFNVCPWGQVVSATELATGIYAVASLTHGGIYVDHAQRGKLPCDIAHLSWFEEDCSWALIVETFPEAFDDDSRASAANILKMVSRQRLMRFCFEDLSRRV